jgi:hypothetical protein
MIYCFGLAAFCIAWLIPGHYFPWTGFQQETAAAVGALLLAVAALASTGMRRLPLPRIAIGVLLLAAVPMLQWAGGQVPYLGDAALSSMYLCAFALTIVAAAALASRFNDTFAACVFAAILVGAVISAGIGLAQWLQVAFDAPMEHMDAGARVYANFTQPNHLASLLGMGIVTAIWFFETRRIGLVGVTLLLVYLFFGVVMTQSRTGWAFVAMLAVWWALGRRSANLRSTSFGVAASVLGFVAMTKFWTPLNAYLDTPTATVLADRATAAGARSINWAVLWDAAWRHPWLGWGWMRVGAAQQAATLDHPPSYEWTSFSHNVVLDLLIWNGLIVGVAACVAIVAWITSRCLRCRDASTWAMLAAGGVLLTHALLEFPHAYAYFLLPLAVFVGFVESRAEPRADIVATSVSNWTFGLTCALMAALLGWVCQEYLAVEEAARTQRLKEAGYVVSGQAPASLNVILLDNQRDFLWFRMTEARAGMSKEDLERMRQVNERFMPPAALLRYAIAAGLNGEPAQARRNLKLICHMWPQRNCDEGRTNWALLQAKFPALRSIDFPSQEEYGSAAKLPIARPGGGTASSAQHAE